MSYANGPRIVTDGLVLYLDAGNSKSYAGSGTDWNDLSGNGNNGALTNGPTFSSINKGAIVTDGVDDYINITENANMRPSTLTAELTFRINSHTNTSAGGAPTTAQYLLFRQNTRTGNFSGYLLGYDEAKSNCGIYVDTSAGTPYSALSSTGTIQLGNNYIVTSVFDNTVMSIYINGFFAASGAKASGISYNANNLLKIGRTAPSGITYDASSNASFYSLRVYNRVLSSSEILQNYNATKGRFGL